jgi:hypothetical protein
MSGRCSVEVSAGAPAGLTEVFRGLYHFLQSNSGKVLPACPDLFLQNPFQFIYYPAIQRYTQCDTESVVKNRSK